MSCTRCESPLEEGDLRCAICALPVPVTPRTHEGTVRAQVLRCSECHAAVAFSAEAQAPHCAFCGATMAIEQPVDPIEVAELRVPFAVSREAAEQSLRGWLGRRGWFAPKTLRDEAVVETLQPLCWAAWIVDAKAQVAWTADSDHNSHRSAWAPHAGQVALSFESICVPASRGLDHGECSALVPFYDLRRAVPVASTIEGEAPAMIESFDAQRSAARTIVQRGIEAVARTRVEPYIPGRRFRNVHVACLLERQTTRLRARVVRRGVDRPPVRGGDPFDERLVVVHVAGVPGLLEATRVGTFGSAHRGNSDQASAHQQHAGTHKQHSAAR